MDIDLDYIMIWIYDLIREYRLGWLQVLSTKILLFLLIFVNGPPTFGGVVCCWPTKDAKDSPIGPRFRPCPWLKSYEFAMVDGPNRTRWVTVLKNGGSFHGKLLVSHNQRVTMMNVWFHFMIKIHFFKSGRTMINHQMVRHFFGNDPLTTQRNSGNPQDLFRSTAGGATTHLPAGTDRWPHFRGGTPFVDGDGWSTGKTLGRPKWIDVWLISLLMAWALHHVASRFWWVACQCFQVLEPPVSRILRKSWFSWIWSKTSAVWWPLKPMVFPHFSSLFKHAEAHGSTLRVLRVVPQEICEGLGVEMMGSEHCGLDDAWMVLPPGTKETKGAGEGSKSVFEWSYVTYNMYIICIQYVYNMYIWLKVIIIYIYTVYICFIYLLYQVFIYFGGVIFDTWVLGWRFFCVSLSG